MAAQEVRLPACRSNIDDWLVNVDAFLGQQDDVTDKLKYGAQTGAMPTSVITAIQHALTKPADTPTFL